VVATKLRGVSLRRIPTGLQAAIALAAATAAAILVNFVLLGVAERRNEPVGKLRSRLDVPVATVSPGTTVVKPSGDDSVGAVDD